MSTHMVSYARYSSVINAVGSPLLYFVLNCSLGCIKDVMLWSSKNMWPRIDWSCWNMLSSIMSMLFDAYRKVTPDENSIDIRVSAIWNTKLKLIYCCSSSLPILLIIG